MPENALVQRLQRQKDALNTAAPGIVRQMAAAGLALARLRVQRQGLTGKHYSPNLLPTFFFREQALNAGGRDYIKKNRLGNWAGLRAAEGLQVAYVDLTHSGRMWNSLHEQPGTSSGGVYGAQVVASDAESAAKVARNRERYGDFLALTPGESAQVQQVAQVAIKRILETVAA